jgi:hypothetical protein
MGVRFAGKVSGIVGASLGLSPDGSGGGVLTGLSALKLNDCVC